MNATNDFRELTRHDITRLFQVKAWYQIGNKPSPKSMLTMFYDAMALMSPMVSPTTSLTIVYSSVYLGADQRKYQSSASLAFTRAIYRWPMNSPDKGPVSGKCFHLMTSSWTAVIPLLTTGVTTVLHPAIGIILHWCPSMLRPRWINNSAPPLLWEDHTTTYFRIIYILWCKI